MRVIVKSRRDAERDNAVDEPHAIISIYTPGDKASEPILNTLTRNVKHFCFADLDRMPSESMLRAFPSLRWERIFDKDMATDMAGFINQATLDGIQCFIVHCDAGVSRSTAVAAAIRRYFDAGDCKYHLQGGRLKELPTPGPNMLVYRNLLDALNTTGATSFQ